MERYPQIYQDLARTIGANVLRCSKAAGQLPDNALLARVARALGYGAVEEDPAREALKVKIDAILDAAEKTGALEEDALAGLPPELAGQVRAAWPRYRRERVKKKPAVDELSNTRIIYLLFTYVLRFPLSHI